jgi:hypothetical protein
MSICLGITAKKQRCGRKLKYEGYCKSHQHQKEKQEPVCEFVSCGHVATSSSDSFLVCSQHLPVLTKVEKPDECPICKKSLDNVRVPLSCGHWVHRDCQLTNHKYTCFICRKVIAITDSERHNIADLLGITLKEVFDQEETDFVNSFATDEDYERYCDAQLDPEYYGNYDYYE